MSPWLLLLLTVVGTALTVDAFRAGGPMKEPPVRSWPRSWKRGMDHVPLGEQDRIFRTLRYPLLGTGVLAWIFLAVTVLLAALTIRAFIA